MTVYEVFKSDGKRFPLYNHDDYFTCECWVNNHLECTTALRLGKSYLVIDD